MCKLGTLQNILPRSFELLGNQRSGSTERADYSHPGKGTGLHSPHGPSSCCWLQQCHDPVLPRHKRSSAPWDPRAQPTAAAGLHSSPCRSYPFHHHIKLAISHHYQGLRCSVWVCPGHPGAALCSKTCKSAFQILQILTFRYGVSVQEDNQAYRRKS